MQQVFEVFFIGLMSKGREISAKGYQRQRLVLTKLAHGHWRNEVTVSFPPGLEPYGWIDGFALAASERGEILAIDSMVGPPIYRAAGVVTDLVPGTITMNQASMDALIARRPSRLIA